MSATQCLDHPWMAQQTAAMSRVALPTEKLKKFIIRRKWQVCSDELTILLKIIRLLFRVTLKRMKKESVARM